MALGHSARGQIRRTSAGGEGWAVAGLALGYVQIAFYVLVAVLFATGICTANISGRTG